ncbi:MAG: glycosyltransferase [Proteobacteria bacterium]|nr:glycosyltransferase [Pseudomonadota bacterium]
MSCGVSVVIRARDEERWIGSCLNAVANQDHAEVEVVVVDDASSDATPAIARRFGARVIAYGETGFNYSRALNLGIAAASKPLVAVLSAHCVPANEQWLARLAMHFHDPKVAAVYGRQEPLPDSHSFDKRDLWTTFGLDRKVQKRDFFFHNANAMIRRARWREIPFNEAIHGVEDQDWAKKVLNAGGRIVYEPTASVFHHHGIHHALSEERAARQVRIIELIRQDLT